ncbi:TetR family transcriptional regulator [Cupriavidus pauculus]|uniref:TetR family transcriptional regulator n=2 Tax=Cupriavidus pauculus TaxID=82633 RepID=A0A2N5C671_9BURK|nr:TetR family transcriptional regulator [Cupriavidus pauculus]
MSQEFTAARPPRPGKTPTGAATKPEGQWHHGDLRASLIAWGLHLIDTEGVAAMSMRTAARLAGVSAGAPSHHFQDRNGLLAAIAAQAFRELKHFKSERAARLPNITPADRLRGLLVGYAEFAHRYPARFHLMFGPGVERRSEYPELTQAAGDSFSRVREAVTACLDGRAPTHLSEDQLAFAVWIAAHGLATATASNARISAVSAEPLDIDQMANVVAEFCLQALRACTG